MLEPGSQEDTQAIWKSGWPGASPLNSRLLLKLMEHVHRTTSGGIVDTTVQLSGTACPAACDGSAQLAFPRPTPGQALLLYVAQSLSLSPLDIIQTHYQPWGFLNAAHTVCPGLFEELLLLLQPLALLPFSLDLLFQHRLLQSGQQQRQHKELLRVSQDLLLSAHSTLQLARSRSQDGPGDVDRAAPGERVKGVGAPEGGEEEEEEEETEAAGSSGRGRWARSGQAGWWYQLMQSSQVYIDGSSEGSRFPRGSSTGNSSEKKKGAGGVGPPPREGVVEGAEACPAPEEALGRERGWPFWMGSPPDSVLAELRRSREREGSAAPTAENEEGASEPSPGGIKWGHLFGSRKVQREARPTNR